LNRILQKETRKTVIDEVRLAFVRLAAHVS